MEDATSSQLPHASAIACLLCWELFFFFFQLNVIYARLHLMLTLLIMLHVSALLLSLCLSFRIISPKTFPRLDIASICITSKYKIIQKVLLHGSKNLVIMFNNNSMSDKC